VKKGALAPTFYSLLHQLPISKFFSVVNVNSILSLNQIKTTSISNSFEQLCLGQQFALVNHLAGISLNTSNQNCHEKMIRTTLFGVLNDKFVSDLAGLVLAHLP